MNRLLAAVSVCILLIYGCAIAAGLHVHDLSSYKSPIQSQQGMNWRAPSDLDIPMDGRGDLIRRGQLIFNETALYAPDHAKAKVSCGNCHAEGGIQPYASPMVGVPKSFPQFNQRANRVISLQDRIQECFVRSENGVPLDYNGAEMKALVEYIQWLSKPQPTAAAFRGRGFAKLPDLTPNPDHGAQVYASQCAGCHGSNGQGSLPQFPPLWGDAAFNDGAGMHGITKMAAFVKVNMPQNRRGILSAQDAYDVSAYIHEQPRPAFNKAYAHY